MTGMPRLALVLVGVALAARLVAAWFLGAPLLFAEVCL
jgi:hypothetical protein